MGAVLRAGDWMHVAARRLWFWPVLRPTGGLPRSSQILPSHSVWGSLSVCVLLNCPWFVICAQASLIAQLVKNLLAKQDTRFNSWVGKIPWRRDRLPTPVFLGFPCGSADKESACNAGDLGSIPTWGRSPGEGKGYPFQYSGLENTMNCIVHGVAKSQT